METMCFQLQTDLKAKIRRIATECGTTPSHIARHFLKAAVDRALETGEIFTISPDTDEATSGDVPTAA